MRTITYIAGGSTGLGAALTAIFQQSSKQVYEFSRSGIGQHHIDCDFSAVSAAKDCFQQQFTPITEPDIDHLNLVINTATLPPFGSLGSASLQSIDQHLNINIHAATYLIQSFLAAYQTLGINKTITYISSGAARRSIPGLAMYSASKAFFERLIDTLATEQQTENHPFKCMVINPGVMDTGMQAEIRNQDPSDFPLQNMWNDWYEQGQLAKPDDIAQVCHDLITRSGENGGYYTAQEFLSTQP